MSTNSLYGKLRISVGGAEGQEYPLTQPVITVGRAPDNNLLLDDPPV